MRGRQSSPANPTSSQSGLSGHPAQGRKSLEPASSVCSGSSGATIQALARAPLPSGFLALERLAERPAGAQRRPVRVRVGVQAMPRLREATRVDWGRDQGGLPEHVESLVQHQRTVVDNENAHTRLGSDLHGMQTMPGVSRKTSGEAVSSCQRRPDLLSDFPDTESASAPKATGGRRLS